MKKHLVVFCLAATGLLFSCQKEAQPNQRGEAGTAISQKSNQNGDAEPGTLVFYALAAGNRLDQFSVGKSEQLLSSATVTGLQPGEQLLAIDFRPRTGQLYGLGSTSRLYVIDPATGAASAVGAQPFTPALSGNIAGFDFNPTVDRIRVVTSTGQNLRLNPITGAVAAVDVAINGADGATITSVAYTNNVDGATTTTLYDIDVTSDKLYKQMPPNNGTLVEVGSLGVNLEGEGGFDIAPNSSGSTEYTALAIYQQNKKSVLYSIDLNTGRATKVEKFEKGEMYYGIAIPAGMMP